MSHLTRALVALAITGSLVIAIPIGIKSGADLMEGTEPAAVYYFYRGILPWFAASVLLLLVFLGVPLTLLRVIRWCRPAVGTPWISAISGALCGAVLSPLWYYSSNFLLYDNRVFSWASYFRGAVFTLPLSILSGAVLFFLHAFLTRKTSLATRAQ